MEVQFLDLDISKTLRAAKNTPSLPPLQSPPPLSVLAGTQNLGHVMYFVQKCDIFICGRLNESTGVHIVTVLISVSQAPCGDAVLSSLHGNLFIEEKKESRTSHIFSSSLITAMCPRDTHTHNCIFWQQFNMKGREE